jgi:hypothetical protein
LSLDAVGLPPGPGLGVVPGAKRRDGSAADD